MGIKDVKIAIKMYLYSSMVNILIYLHLVQSFDFLKHKKFVDRTEFNYTKQFYHFGSSGTNKSTIIDSSK